MHLWKCSICGTVTEAPHVPTACSQCGAYNEGFIPQDKEQEDARGQRGNEKECTRIGDGDRPGRSSRSGDRPYFVGGQEERNKERSGRIEGQRGISTEVSCAGSMSGVRRCDGSGYGSSSPGARETGRPGILQSAADGRSVVGSVHSGSSVAVAANVQFNRVGDACITGIHAFADVDQMVEFARRAGGCVYLQVCTVQ